MNLLLKKYNMKTRKTLAFIGAGLLFFCCLMTYIIVDLTIFPPGQDNKLSMQDVSS